MGTLQPFADALKLVVKENVIPQHATKSLFYLAPIISLRVSLLG
jgi:NADH-ubiquinone oxidoreductase chain 1